MNSKKENIKFGIKYELKTKLNCSCYTVNNLERLNWYIAIKTAKNQ